MCKIKTPNEIFQNPEHCAVESIFADALENYNLSSWNNIEAYTIYGCAYNLENIYSARIHSSHTYCGVVVFKCNTTRRVHIFYSIFM